MSGMSKNLVGSEFSKLVSDDKDKFVHSDDEREISFAITHEEPEQQERDSNSRAEVDDFNRDLCLTQTPYINDEIDIKYEVNDIQHISVGEDGLDNDALLSKINTRPAEYRSINSEEKELTSSQLYLDLLRCEQDCLICQKYIQKLSEHVRSTHSVDQPSRDPLCTESAIEIKCDGDIERMECSEESDSYIASEVESGSDSDPDYNISRDLSRKRKTGQKISGKATTQDRSSRKDKTVCQTKIPIRGKPIKCEACHMGFTSQSALSIHLRSHTGEKPFKCEECGKNFAQKNNLTTHMRIHAPEKPYKCGQCAKSFTTKSQLDIHVMIHTGERPFNCEVCGKPFRKSSHLTVHLKSHTGQKPFKCEECNRSFNTKTNLTVHKIFHISEKPFVCEHCGRSFKTKNYLTDHLTTHTGERAYNCEECGKNFRTSSALGSHRKSHNEGRPYKCDICEMYFKRPDNLRAHKKNTCQKRNV